jgi:nicotinate-nucleotide--dimethylbenzimidazole phosphoribosyltransferase
MIMNDLSLPEGPHFDHCAKFALSLPDIPGFDQTASARAEAHQQQLTKPPGSLGRLEGLATFYAGAKGMFPTPTPSNAFIPVIAADHGVAADGVSAFPAHLTTPILQNVVNGGAGICVLARQFDVELLAVDVGMTGDLVQAPQARVPSLTRKLRRGTRNLRVEDAMTADEARDALALGMEIAHDRARAGVDVVGIGEIGIGNTTSAAALIAAYTGLPARQVTGKGSGIDAAGLEHKIDVIETALERVADRRDPLEIACALGGLEILCMAGFVIGSVSERVPVVVDGVIAAAAMLVAQALRPGIERFCVASHRSTEPGMLAALEQLQLKPLLDLEMRLGEGTGAVIGIALLRAAVALSNEMATFASAGLV